MRNPAIDEREAWSKAVRLSELMKFEGSLLEMMERRSKRRGGRWRLSVVVSDEHSKLQKCAVDPSFVRYRNSLVRPEAQQKSLAKAFPQPRLADCRGWF